MIKIVLKVKVSKNPYLYNLVKPISLVGFMGCGKSSTGRELAEILGQRFVDLDELVVLREGRSIPEMFREGEASFRKAESLALTSLLDPSPERPFVLALGGGTLGSSGSLSLVLERTHPVWLRTRLDTIRARLGEKDSGRPLFVDAERLYSEREHVYSMSEFVVDTDGLEPREVALRIAGMLGYGSVDR